MKKFSYMTEEDFGTLLNISGYRMTNASPWTFEFNGEGMRLGFEREDGSRMKWNINHPAFSVLFEPNDMPTLPDKPSTAYGLVVKGDYDAYLKFVTYLRLLQ